MAAPPAAALPDGVDPTALVRRFEPVIRYTQGELFFPTSVDAYVRQAALWGRPPGDKQRIRLVDHGGLDLDRLSAAARANSDTELQLRYVPGALTRGELRQWRRDPDRPRFSSTSRFAAVGLLGRIIDSLFRITLILRGAVPGGLTAALHRRYRDSAAAAEFPYYAHVSSHGQYVVLQYWFFYALNDWRSTFGGVNDHEADWEQVTVCLAPIDPPILGTGAARQPDGTDVLDLAWVAFSSHDETGDDLRRRPDDPDISWVGGTHAVVNAGAGSHSGAYLPGEYLVRVEPPALRGVLASATRIRRVLFPWTRDRPGSGLGIPYIDYKRGDGVQIGPGTGRAWTAVLVDAGTPWVRDFNGLWGLDTDDPFGGERAPAGPRYERNGTIRPSWADPVGWAGLDKVPATRAAQQAVAAARLAELAGRYQALTADLAAQEFALQQLNAGVRALPPTLAADRRGGIGADRRLQEQEALVADLRSDRRAVVIEGEHLTRARQDRPAPVDPHAHLRRRALPDVDPVRPPGKLLRFWTEVSLSVLLALLGLSLLFDYSSVLNATVGAILVVSTVEAVLRRRLAGFLLGLVVVASVAGLVYLMFTNLRLAVGVLLLVASVAILIANLRAFFARR